ncbi:MAG: hypothetical protein ACI8S6_002626 [Myxococcota bacterium]|jgi:hypothetical protein
MRLSAYLYLGGMLLLLLGERIFGGGEDPSRAALSLLGVLSILGAVGLVGSRLGQGTDDQKAAHRTQLVYGIVGIASLVVYLCSTDLVIDSLSLSEDGETRAVMALSTLWPIVWMAGSLPFVAIDRYLSQHPVHVPSGRAREVGYMWLSAAFAVAMLFPINYIASDTNQRWDLGYFKTAEPGTATVGVLDTLEVPVTAYLFFPSSSDVTGEVRAYFDALPPSANFNAQLVDHALEPALAEELKVRDNGYVVFVRGEGDDQQVERIKIGTDFDSARRTLKKLDTEVFESLLKVAQGPRVAYVTVGHNEMYWKSDLPQERRLNDLKKALKQLNYQVKELGLANGLASEVPEDASVVLVLSPEEALLPEEVIALNTYRRSGGKLLITLDPSGPDLSGLLAPLGVSYNPEAFLATDQNYIPSNRGPLDRVNLATNKFSTHESVTTLSRNNRTLFLVAPSSAEMTLDEASTEDGITSTVTVRALESTWSDLDRDLSLGEGEKRDKWPLVIAAEGEGTSRAIVVADGTWASDLVLFQNKGNAQLLLDSLAWLNQEELSTGTVNDEKDIKIQHTREGQGWIFYSTALLLPLGFLLGGLTRVRMRKKRS